MNRKGNTDAGVGCVLLLFWLALISGYFMNIYKLVQCDFKPSYKAEVIRGIGIATGVVGCVVGWLDIEDGESTK